MKTSKAFTLIELLVVISIISLLSSVVLSSLNTARERARVSAGKQFSSTVYRAAGDMSIGLWRLNEGSGTSLSDLSAIAGSAILVNGQGASSWTTDTPWGTDYALTLDGVNDYMSISDRQEIKYRGGDLTFSIWIKPGANETNGGLIFSKPWNGSGQYNYTVSYNTDRTISIGLVGATTYALGSSHAVAAGKWSHVAVVLDSSRNAKIYVDGSLKASGVHSIVSWTPSSDEGTPLCIGTLYPYGSGWGGIAGFSFEGLIDDPMLFNKTLTAMEVRSMYARGISKFAAK